MNEIKFLDLFMNERKVGRISSDNQQLNVFEYDAAWLTHGFSISPLHLPLRNELFVARPTPFAGGFGVFDDSLPDGWGNLLLDRYLTQQGINPRKITLLQRLALIGSTGRGALEYRPDLSEATAEERLNLDKLAKDSEKILTTDQASDSLETLFRHGGASGGARPKVFVTIDGTEWLIKFRALIDPHNIGKIEYQYSHLARQCGIPMPRTRLFEGKYFGVERFDRTPQGRIHTVSAAGLLNADYRVPSIDYEDLLKLSGYLTQDRNEVYALFRQMVFNIIIGNMDDHAKNFSFQYINGKWRNSPAYDLLPSEGFNGFHTTTVNNNGAPTIDDMMAVATRVALNADKARTIIEEVSRVVKENRGAV